jgi:hypothetical protein
LPGNDLLTPARRTATSSRIEHLRIAVRVDNSTRRFRDNTLY